MNKRLRDVGERVSYELRNDYEVRITELEQKLTNDKRPANRVACNIKAQKGMTNERNHCGYPRRMK